MSCLEFTEKNEKKNKCQKVNILEDLAAIKEDSCTQPDTVKESK